MRYSIIFLFCLTTVTAARATDRAGWSEENPGVQAAKHYLERRRGDSDEQQPPKNFDELMLWEKFSAGQAALEEDSGLITIHQPRTTYLLYEVDRHGMNFSEKPVIEEDLDGEGITDAILTDTKDSRGENNKVVVPAPNPFAEPQGGHILDIRGLNPILTVTARQSLANTLPENQNIP